MHALGIFSILCFYRGNYHWDFFWGSRCGFELNRKTNNGDLISDRKKKKKTETHITLCYVLTRLTLKTTNNSINKKHSENTDTSTSVTFDLDVWPWPYFKIKKAYVIRCRLLYCALVSGMMSVNVKVCEIWKSTHFLWPLTFTYDLQLMSRSLSI